MFLINGNEFPEEYLKHFIQAARAKRMVVLVGRFADCERTGKTLEYYMRDAGEYQSKYSGELTVKKNGKAPWGRSWRDLLFAFFLDKACFN